MSDKMLPIPFCKLINWILEEYRSNSTIFSVRKGFIKDDTDKYYSLFGEKMETAFGPAAGPHTQLAQNIIAAYFAGARFFELKTVQTLDGEDLPVSKPCIKADEEGYNVEWSTELRVPDAMNEYIKAWFAIKLISQEFNLGSPEGFIFNMSVGYDLNGIKSEKISNFIEGLKNAQDTDSWKECKEFALGHIYLFENIDKRYVELISPNICTSVTLSTLHGCPPAEIERIAIHLLKEKNLNTFIKCNPTLLGYNYARQTLNEMGYNYLTFDEYHFKNDLQYKDAVPMFERLINLSAKQGLTFGVKLTNTFPVEIKNNELPGEEMYMSGAALYPLSISLANKLTQSFDGRLQISFSGGADFYNINNLLDSGIMPVTMATTLLKPGGYSRLTQIAESFEKKLSKKTENVIKFKGTNEDSLKEITIRVKGDKHHIKSIKPKDSFKSSNPLTLTDCFISPCEEGCPINQDIPEYIELAGEGKYKEALDVIMSKNPLPFITGTICNHKCMGKCIRNFYEEPVHIREVKLEAASNAYKDILTRIVPNSKNDDRKTAIVGGGPAGIAAAYFLAKEGVKVTIFEKEESLGGTVKYVIPEFRILDDAIEKDISFIKALGVEVKTNTRIMNDEQLLKNGYKNIIVAIGAGKTVEADIKGADPLYSIEFLKDAKKGIARLGENVVVVGGGNTAMDAARTAKRISGVKKVTIVYRRTKRLMPADEEEIQFAINDGVIIFELLNPISLEEGILTCEKMILGDLDESGRRAPQPTGELKCIKADDIIIAMGEKPDTDFIIENFSKNAYIIGDCKDKAKTVVEAIKDAKDAVDTILNSKSERKYKYSLTSEDIKNIKKGILKHYSKENESKRCLQCKTICENCVDVCPNRANIEIIIGKNEMPQILHIDDMCNECGNCASFCPTSGLPYKDKLTLFSSKESMEGSQNLGFYINHKTREVLISSCLNKKMTEKIDRIIEAVKSEYSYLI